MAEDRDVTKSADSRKEWATGSGTQVLNPEVGYTIESDRSKLTTENNGTRENFAFSEKSIRLAFIRKVYSILMVQLLISAAFIAFFTYNDQSRDFINAYPQTILISCIITLVIVISMSCCVTARRVAPLNYVCLFIFTIAKSFLLGAVCTQYSSSEVLLAVGICAVVCFALTIFACQTKYDFTVCGAGLFLALLLFFIFSLVLLLVPFSDYTYLVFAGFGCILFSLYLVYDTQLLIGGKHKYSVSPEEYVFAALNIYLDVVQLFLLILRLVTGIRTG